MTSALLQWFGAAGILAAYALAQRERWSVDGRPYLVTNAVAGALLCTAAVITSHWGFAVLNVFWTLFSLRGLVAPATARPE